MGEPASRPSRIPIPPLVNMNAAWPMATPGLPVSRPAVSQHLKVLKEAGLVAEEQDGTRRIYRIDPNGLGQLRAWFDQFWEMALDAFKAEAEKDAGKSDTK